MACGGYDVRLEGWAVECVCMWGRGGGGGGVGGGGRCVKHFYWRYTEICNNPLHPSKMSINYFSLSNILIVFLLYCILGIRNIIGIDFNI